ncbi:MAG: hypothetical protein QUV11_02635 [Blastomonas sp.]|nr:hypothetical protein [Blastomonas sp.]MDM7955266.1 hypothetical protein [Blastomonas sp.]
MNLRLLDWIWNIRGSVPLAPGQSSDEAFARLDPLFQQPGTTYERTGDTLVFAKKDQAAQDKMSIFDAGALQIEPGAGGAVLRYRMASRALLFCFLAPLLFLAFGQLTVAVGKFAGPDTEAAEKDKKDEKKKDVVRELHPIDKFLGAPAPEKPKDDKKEEKKDHSHSPTAAYVFAAIFAALYAAGRILEDRLIRSLFRKRLHAAEA